MTESGSKRITISWNKGSAHLARINIGSRNQLPRDWMGWHDLAEAGGTEACLLRSALDMSQKATAIRNGSQMCIIESRGSRRRREEMVLLDLSLVFEHLECDTHPSSTVWVGLCPQVVRLPRKGTWYWGHLNQRNWGVVTL